MLEYALREVQQLEAGAPRQGMAKWVPWWDKLEPIEQNRLGDEGRFAMVRARMVMEKLQRVTVAGGAVLSHGEGCAMLEAMELVVAFIESVQLVETFQWSLDNTTESRQKTVQHQTAQNMMKQLFHQDEYAQLLPSKKQPFNEEQPQVLPHAFRQFWAAYPKQGRQHLNQFMVYRIWQQVVQEVDQNLIVRGAKAYAKFCILQGWRDQNEYYAAHEFLNEGCFGWAWHEMA
ncbi:hypothetical protein Mmc1_1685 [Magnetococcus marinus MC-1]|uniref:Uncharacterized protein n=2 Tax=Magnetococcus TaxID=162171 RepID=A0L8A1_MAGMM|nr:hypothetical protein Mmc1_1685 [Magnetococcus marinus MC-1]